MSLLFNAKETALVLIDLEHGIVSRQLAPHSGTEVVARCASLAAKMRAVGTTVVYVHVLLNETLTADSDKPQPKPPVPPPVEASELVPEAGFQPGKDVLIIKRQWDAFYATNLDQVLRRQGIRTIVLGGIATNFGVESTARSAQSRGYNLVIAHDAMSSMSTEMHEFATKILFPIIGKVRSTAEILNELK